MVTPQEVLEELKKVKYPGFARDIVSFGMIKDIEVGSTGINVILAPTTAKEDVVQQIRDAVVATVTTLAAGLSVQITIAQPPQPARRGVAGPAAVPGIRHIVAVASGKGGVGKSTVASNFALALASLGHRVGLMDADVYGPSIGLMLGLNERPTNTEDKRIVALERFGIKVMSFGLFVADGTPVIWRGPMINKLLTQFLREVEWGELDYLVLDLPPGTGDAQLTITQQVPLDGGIIVTTPQDVALEDVKRGVKMFQQVHAPILGVIENMSYHVCSHCGDRAEIFGHGGGATMAQEFEIPFLGAIPLVRDLRVAADNGTPLVVAEPQHAQSQAFRAIAQKVVDLIEERPAAALPTIH